MYLSVKEFYFFSLIFVVITITLFVFNKKLVTSKNSYLHLGSFLMVSLLATLSFVLTYKFGKIGNCQTDNFRFEVSPGKKCRGYPYMQSGDPKLLEECTKFLATEKGKNMKSCDGMYVGKPSRFEYTPESNDQWENNRCKCKNIIQESNHKIVPNSDGESSDKIVPNSDGESSDKIAPNSDGESSDKIVINEVPIYDGNSLGISPTSQSYDRYIKKSKVVSFAQNK
jgi:hypothetical protein